VANLLANAVEHSGGKPVRVSAGQDDGHVWLRVADRGPGVPVEDRERIFQPFQRGRGEPGRRGAGLGLAIARGFAEANGGTLRLETGEGSPGAAFVLELRGGEPERAVPTRAETPV
jgi:two-component system sensor histidine kinase KdpD